nr:MAG TPA: hypothetical protein [Caudoviricetes sp.]
MLGVISINFLNCPDFMSGFLFCKKTQIYL